MAAGLFVLAAAVLILVWSLDMRVTAEALAHHGMYVERRLGETVREVALEEFGAGGGGLPEFSQRMVTLARHSPAVRELVVVGPDRAVVRRFGVGEARPCFAALPHDRHADHEHAAGTLAEDPVGCLVLPVTVGGERAASVYLHVTRDWSEGGALVKDAVRRTAMQLAPVFAGFYLLLGGMLVLATRAAQRWRRKAVQAERVEALGALASGINHEIKNPLNALGLALQVLRRRHKDAESQETLAMADDQAKRIVGTLDEFARFTRVAELQLAPADLGPRIEAAAARHEFPATLTGTATARVDVRKFDDAVDSILEVAMRFRTGDSEPALALREAGGRWQFEVAVESADFDPAMLDHLFDPYVRTQPRDVGRGLAWARAVLQAHGGDVTVDYRNQRLVLRADALTSPGE